MAGAGRTEGVVEKSGGGFHYIILPRVFVLRGVRSTRRRIHARARSAPGTRGGCGVGGGCVCIRPDK